MTQIFHTSMSLGNLAVDCFFLISGYLITGSFLQDRRGYLLRRALRIYPAFIVCSLLCLLIVSPLGGGVWGHHILGDIARMALLAMPDSYGAFAGRPYPFLDGSMWTISYEFRCYVLTALLGTIGLLRRPRLFVALIALLLAANLVNLWPGFAQRAPELFGWGSALIGDAMSTLRLAPIFMVGACFRLFSIPLSARAAGICAALLLPLLFVDVVGEIALATLGAYVLFWFALTTRNRLLQTVNAKDDISYGIYLYAWPVTALVVWHWPHVGLATLVGVTLSGAALCGAASWWLIEKPAQGLRKWLAARRQGAVQAPA